MTTMTNTMLLDPPRRDIPITRPDEVIAVVAHDGSASSHRALDQAVEIVKAHGGRLEIVFVAHIPATAMWWPTGWADLIASFDKVAASLRDEVRELASRENIEWRFQRRQGDIVHELQAAYDEIAASAGPATRIVLVAGGPTHLLQHYLPSIASTLAHKDRSEVLIVP